MPKADWTLETAKGDYAGSYTMWGEPVTSGEGDHLDRPAPGVKLLPK